MDEKFGWKWNAMFISIWESLKDKFYSLNSKLYSGLDGREGCHGEWLKKKKWLWRLVGVFIIIPTKTEIWISNQECMRACPERSKHQIPEHLSDKKWLLPENQSMSYYSILLEKLTKVFIHFCFHKWPSCMCMLHLIITC